VIRTLEVQVTELRPIGGFCVGADAGPTVVGTAMTPVSTRHPIPSSHRLGHRDPGLGAERRERPPPDHRHRSIA